MMNCRNLILGVWLIAIALSVSCQEEIETDVPQTNYIYQRPDDLGDGLDISDLHSVGLDSMPIKIMMDSIEAGRLGIFHSLLILKNNKLVLEEYFNEWNRYDLHLLLSVTKSIASSVIGIAIDQGHIANVDKSIHELLPSFNQVGWTDDSKMITLEHFLTMSSGYVWDESSAPFDDPQNSHYQMVNSDDWIRYVLELPLDSSPGERFKYNTGTSTLFSVIIQEATGQNFKDFAHDHLFTKLDIHDYSWITLPGDYPATGGTGGGLWLKSRDMAKFGLLYMNDGEWNNEVVVSRDWVNESLAAHINVLKDGSFTYGYQWWRNEKVASQGGEVSVPYGVGTGGQYIFLIKDYDLLVVITSPFTPSLGTLNMFEMMEDYIIEAIL